MNYTKFFSISLFAVAVLTAACGKAQTTAVASEDDSTAATAVGETKKTANNENDIPEGAKRIIAAYPDFNLKYAENRIIFPDNTSIVYDDHKKKSFTEMMDDCDVEDMFSMKYDRNSQKPEYLEDAGRGRCEPLFKKMYGNSEGAARANLVRVKWFGQSLLFTKVNGAAKQLEKVAAELSQHPELRKYFDQSSTFYWRKVRSANRQSAHSYGIAIDICTKFSNYWLWSNKGSGEMDKLKYENKVPQKIVEIFEKHGFIWGGRWYHYDTMHFEYRPEFLITK